MLSRQITPTAIYRIEIKSRLNSRCEALKTQIISEGFRIPPEMQMSDVYFLQGNLTESQIEKIAADLITDPVIEEYTFKQIKSQNRVKMFNCIETALKPGVTDNVATELVRAVHQAGIAEDISAKTGQSYTFSDGINEDIAHLIAKRFLVNDTIQYYVFGEIWPEFIHPHPGVTSAEKVLISSLDEVGLTTLSKERRLALNLDEMRAIQDYYRIKGNEPTDAELETLAQTWSEHCVHKTFKAEIQVQDSSEQIHSIIKTYLQAATQKINADWVRSAFVDNAGVIAFDEDYDLSFKVETHNHPSAIEPFGGANTGIGGVVRDILGVSHRPIANTDVLCFGPQNTPDQDLPAGVLHPRRIKAGVVHGIEDYGNKLGLPTVNGSIHYHPGYISNPLVYCGSVGIGPRDCHRNQPKSGDRVIVIGGRTGRDGIRGATFSSQPMDTDTGEIAGSSVQIGDPITEKGVMEVVERARDAGLYTAITDCGAGGLSSAVGEMSANLGVRVDLAHVPLKYPGLSTWEIWLSEAQERMVMAVPQENLAALKDLCSTYWVEMSDIGEFQDSGRLQVFFGDSQIVDLGNDFLHNGIPPLTLEADMDVPVVDRSPVGESQKILTNIEMLLALLRHPDITSKEDVVRQYDHEVRGSTVVKPLAGPEMDGPSDAAVLKPTNTKGWKGFSLANGINPTLGEADAYSMAVSVIDEAVRNAVVVGTDPEKIAILDNFCWGNPNDPKILGSLVRAAQGCYDASVHYGTPFISGKDSLYNEYYDNNGERHAIPGTLLISSIGIVPDIRETVMMDLKSEGNLLYLVGAWQGALAGSHAVLIAPDFFDEQPALTQIPFLPEDAPLLYRSLHKAIRLGLVSSAHDLSEGGLAVALAEMALAGRLGAAVDISWLSPDMRVGLFAETNGCLLVEIPTEHQKYFEEVMEETRTHLLGKVTSEPSLVIAHAGSESMVVNIETLVAAFIRQEVRI